MSRLLRCAFVLAVTCGACSEPPAEDGATAVAAVGKQVASDTALIRYLGRAQVKARQGEFEARHPGWGVTRIGQLTGSIGAEDTAPPGPAAPALSSDDYVRLARAFLLLDIDLHEGFAPDELALYASTKYKPDVPSADVYPDGYGGHEVIFFATTHPAGFTHVESLAGSLAYSVRFGPDNAIVGIETETGSIDTRGLPAGVVIPLPAQPGLSPTDPTALEEVLGRTLPPWNDGWMTWRPVRAIAQTDIVAVDPTVLKVPVAQGIQLTVAFHVVVHMDYVSAMDPSIHVAHELHFIVDGANGDFLADNDDGVQSSLATDMLDVRCTSSISFPGACSP